MKLRCRVNQMKRRIINRYICNAKYRLDLKNIADTCQNLVEIFNDCSNSIMLSFNMIFAI